MSRFHYFAGEQLSEAELTAACLDGHLVGVDAAFIPADAIETPWMRARSLAPLLGTALAATRITVAWIYGAVDTLPGRFDVQRCAPRRLHHISHPRLRYHDLRLPPADTDVIAGVAVATLARTIADLARTGDEPGALAALAAEHPVALRDAARWLDRAVRHPGIRTARLRVRELADAAPHARPDAGQDEVTR